MTNLTQCLNISLYSILTRIHPKSNKKTKYCQTWIHNCYLNYVCCFKWICRNICLFCLPLEIQPSFLFLSVATVNNFFNLPESNFIREFKNRSCYILLNSGLRENVEWGILLLKIYFYHQSGSVYYLSNKWFIVLFTQYFKDCSFQNCW